MNRSAINVWQAASAADITDTTSTAVKAAGGADRRYFITDLTVSNMHATVATRVDILSGSTVVWSGPAAALGGGFDHSFQNPVTCGVNEAINAQCGTTGAAVRVAIAGYTSDI